MPPDPPLRRGRSLGVTLRGVAFLVIVPSSYALGRLLGAVEMAVLSAAALALLGAGTVAVCLARPTISATRTFHPHRLSVGSYGRAQIDVGNRGRWHSPPLVVEDVFADTRRARLIVPPVPAGSLARASYRIPTDRRGLYSVGPLRVSVTDPLGLVVRRVVEFPPAQVTVYPHVHEVSAPAPSVGQDVVGTAAGRLSRTRASQEFHALREYATGDDLRRVHWRSTARLGRLMVREDDVPWQLRATVLLHTSSEHFRAESFERAVEACASVVTALHRRNAVVRYLDTSGADVGPESGREHYETVMEALATVERGRGGSLEGAVARLRRESGGGLAVLALGAVDDDVLLGLGPLRRRFSGVIALRHLGGGAPAPARPVAANVVFVDLPPASRFDAAWEAATAVARRGSGRPGGRWRSPA